MKPTIKELQKECFAIAGSKGWHDKPRSFAEVIALIHSEASEALEAYRESKPDPLEAYPKDQPQVTMSEQNPLTSLRQGQEKLLQYPYRAFIESNKRILEELADVCIRVFDAAEEFQLGDLEDAILEKMEKNRHRPHRHGGKKC